jgi:hypothetical protein
LADEAERHLARPRIAAERCLEIARCGPEIPPFGLHEDTGHAAHAAAFDGDGADRAADVAVGAQKNGTAALAEVHRDPRQSARVRHLGAIVERHDVVGAAVVRIDPAPGRVDVARRGLERRLSDVAKRRSDESRLLAVGLDPNFRVVHLQRFAHIANPRHGPSHLRNRLRLGVELVEIIALDLDDERSGVAVGEHARDEAPRVLQELDARKLAIEDLSRQGRHIGLRELAPVGLIGERDEAVVGE